MRVEGARLGAPFEGGLLNFQGHSRGPPLVGSTEKEKGREYGTGAEKARGTKRARYKERKRWTSGI